ncbi:Starch-binding associating with outer membrane [Chitinophaga costaii]|uniref:Starch-binding associating with outer membrane n=1 Tax=Chitinophaga costaii TaxID=1335309 RepID=A0A1C4FTJ7_9BACT|nr:RagB/SusD family nutrient uptake outer membrane protein [Chitinophaga costaii]PUZ27313.1 RagB/SusD family nutrient uptake outer membrane protein [Chitinophaga costaii]SCC59280.1 Starch-binding associating with outer membrane [Chitinophaga costaii]
MKNIFLKTNLLLTGLLLCSTWGCNKSFLDQQPLGVLSATVLANKQGVESLLVGAYSMLDGYGGNSGGTRSPGSNWVMSMAAGDAYKGSSPSDGAADVQPIQLFNMTTSNTAVSAKWLFEFDAIQRCNDVLRTIPLATDISDEDIKRITGETRFLRGFYYFELKKIYNQVPYIDENTKDVNQPNDKDIWPNIEADFQYAVDNLPPTQALRGRANSWAAMAYLAKAYMFQHKFDAALPLLTKVINEGVTAGGQKYVLVPFQQNFSPQAAQKNSGESVWACQTSVNDGSNGSNGNRPDDLNFPYNGGPGACCGYFPPSQSLANSFKTDANGLPLFTSFDTGNDVSDPTTPYTGTLDPRIDLTMGRPNIPYLDWGYPQPSWIRDPTNGRFTPRKNVYSQSERATNVSNESYWGSPEITTNNINLMRFSDVILMAAEAEIEASAGNADRALAYVNQIRARAADASGWVYKNATYDAGTSQYTPQTTPADKYLIKPYPAGAFNDKSYARTAIHFERKIELAMEGHRFFDLQRWDLGTGSMANEINAFLQYDVKINTTLKGGFFTKGRNEYLPIPQQQIDLSAAATGVPLLVQNPGYVN